MAYLILLRHGQSEWNALNKFTGLKDIGIDETGKQQSRLAAETISQYPIDTAFVSSLKRTTQTLEQIQAILGTHWPVTSSAELNERDYGEYTGLNKTETGLKLGGEDELRKLRREWAYPVPGGETLRDVYERVVPYFHTTIEPLLHEGKSVLVVAHGNSLRALIKWIESVSDEGIAEVELGTAVPRIYTVTKDSNENVWHYQKI